MTERERPPILCVDDELAVLEGLRDNLRRHFLVSVAGSGEEGLEAMRASEFAVVLSDMRMPGMDGAAFLTRARQLAPDTVRMLLTGHADVDSAIAAVNDGQVFRFLTKPCPAETLIAALTAGAEHHRLVRAERELLEHTLTGAVKALASVLSLASPAAFGRATRVKELVLAVADQIGLPERWKLRIAATVSQLGYVVLPPATAEKVYEGRSLTGPEEQLARSLPQLGAELVKDIPRLEAVRQMVLGIDRPWSGEHRPWPTEGSCRPRSAPCCSGSRGTTTCSSRRACRRRWPSTPSPLVGSSTTRRSCTPLVRALGTEGAGATIAELPLGDVRLGMAFVDDVRRPDGTLLLARGHEVTPLLLRRLEAAGPDVRALVVRVAVGVVVDEPAAAA
ncbi:MAG: response regulator [Thermoleophilia bacterium]